ncbi:MAG: methyltransferase domain-containing protein [Chloroflexota bacterium]
MSGFGAFPDQNWLLQQIGWPNLIKRLQAPSILNQMRLSPGMRVLDLGCGGGHFSLEFARQGAMVVGVDTNFKLLHRMTNVGRNVQGPLAACLADGRSLPFPPGCFDRVFISELLGYVSDLDGFFSMLKPLVKAEGMLVIANGLGHPAVARLYRRMPSWMNRMNGRLWPASYTDYIASLNKGFGNVQSRFWSEEEISKAVKGAGFSIREKSYQPGYIGSTFISYMTFGAHLVGGKTYGRRYFAAYPLLAALDRLDSNRSGTGLLMQALV